MINKIGFLLVKPQLPENIGFCARGLKNFGFKTLDIISPKETWPNKKAIATSVGAKDILNKTKVYTNIQDAIKKYDIIYASSVRRRDINKRHLSFNEFIKNIKMNKKKKIGIMFGPEASGLSNDDISYSNFIFKIPVNRNFEFFKKEKKLIDIKSKKKLNIFLNFVESRLEKKGFFSPREKKKIMLINLRNIFERTQLSNKELRILSSVFSKL